MPGSDEPAQATRPALATAGGLLLAVALLQIAQQVIGVFSPRPSIQVALVVAVGLAALTAERMRAAQGSRDPIALISGAVCLAALALAGVIWATSGFSTPPRPTLGAQVDDIRDKLRARGYAVTHRRLALQEDAASHLFVAGRPSIDASRRPSDEIFIYDNDHGTLRQALDFRPKLTSPELPNAASGAKFSLWAVNDIDGDGQREVLASWDTNMGGAEFQRVPVLVSRRPKARYAVTPVLDVHALGGSASEGLMTYGFGPAGRRGSPSIWVSDLALDNERRLLDRAGTLATSVVSPEDPHRLAATVVPADANGRRAFGIPRKIRFWQIDVGGERPRALPMCVLGSSRRNLLIAAADFQTSAYLGRPLADALSRGGTGLGDFHDNVCGDPAL
jgi:hypothetical protein